MSKLPNEAELFKKALQVGAVYAKKRAYGEIEETDAVKLKVEFIYKVLVQDKLIQPLAKGPHVGCSPPCASFSR